MGTLGFAFRVALPYQVDVIDLYVLEEGVGHTLCVPLHSWVIWKLTEREKCI